jgi:hypothetical protein
MWSGVVLLKHKPLGRQKWKDLGSKNFIDVSLRIQASFNLNQWTPSVEIDHSPHHYTSTTVCRSFINTILNKTFIWPTVDPTAHIMAVQQKCRFVTKPDTSPFIATCPGPMLGGPNKSILTMALR